ncbi:DHH family phosphoesterase [Lactiplantibacillus plantarum]|nr:DHH family phosphoesterase [Lactiplantibacillus plantarum]
MKKIFSREKIPFFLQNQQLRLLALVIFSLSLIMLVTGYLMNWIFGTVVLILIVMAVVISYNTLIELSSSANEYISDLSYRIKRGEQEALIQMPIGVMIFNSDQTIEWINPYLQRYFGDKDVLGYRLEDIEPTLAATLNAHLDEPATIRWQDYQFDVRVQQSTNTVYMMDVTKYAELTDQFEDEKLVIGQIFLDNYDEITQSMTDTDISNLNNYVTNELSKWTQMFGMYLKRLDDDHFFLLGYASSLRRVEENKFRILDRIRESTSKQNFPLTLSIGIAYGERNMNNLADLAQSNMDLALGRGGDQVVVKSEDEPARFYGGKTNPMEKRTRVRARMISQTLQELMNQSDQIFVQGHRQPDMDAVGACLGIRRIAEMNGKQCWIVLDEQNVHSDIQRLLDQLKSDENIESAIISPEEALEKATDQSLLIMADHSKPSISMSQALYERLENRVMIIDHHRRGEEFPENPVLVYIEPYASSTCELITEMFEYQSHDAEPINKIEATAMLTGIVIDTKSFSLRSGSRTFDAASYLRSAGADSLLVQQFMKENVDSYLQRNHLIETVEFVNQDMALCVGEDDQVYDPVTAAQAADSLLSMSGVDASFVITRREDGRVGISARSLGEINVQVYMEKLGGGGHLSNAATQIEGQSVKAVKQSLIDLLTATDEPTTESN